ncbi:MAG: ABC transporter permease subunit, partial [Anaerolineae bacterium]|nr:ABC transporter permease subunit [Anaerolineae bacterium]
ILSTLLPVIALQFGYLLSGTVITESIFQRTGIGTVLLRATLQQDYPVVQGVVLLMAIIYTVLTLLSDSGVMLLDPRMRMRQEPD